MAEILRRVGTEQDDFLEYVLVTDAATAELAVALSEVMARLRSRRSRGCEEGVAIRLATQMNHAVQGCRHARLPDWTDLWLPPNALVQ